MQFAAALLSVDAEIGKILVFYNIKIPFFYFRITMLGIFTSYNCSVYGVMRGVFELS